MVRRAPALERSSSADVYRSALTRPERKNYIDAVKCLSKKPALTPASVSAGARSRFDDFVATKNRLGVDQWGSDGIGVAEVTQPVQDLIAAVAPDFDPYPWGRFDFVRTLLLNITMAQPLAHEYAKRFRGLDDSELDALADSFAFESCQVRQPLLTELQRGLPAAAAAR